MFTSVSNMVSANGNKVANQFVLHEANGDISLQSYDSLVCQIRKGSLGFDRVVAFGRDWDYSRTTVKYVNKFLTDNGLDVLAGTKNIREGIERGHARYDEAIAVLYDRTMY
jgi:hypothetical protein